MIFLFHGSEEFAKSERIAALKAELGEYADLNCTELQGKGLSKDELQHHCDVPPFLGEHRLVIAHNLLTRLNERQGKDGKPSQATTAFVQWLTEYLPTVPPTTRLVLDEDKSLQARNKVVQAVKALGEQGEVTAFKSPSVRGGELAKWVAMRAEALGIELARGVAVDLASFIGSDLRLIDSELTKLGAYAVDQQVTQEMVRILVPYAQDANIFDMVDALGKRQTSLAFRLLARLRSEGAHPLYLLTMVVRQYRLLLQVNDLTHRGMNKDEIASATGVHPYPVSKAMQQARSYTTGQLKVIYDRLLETDVSIKTGRMEANLALDLLVAELARV